MAFNSKPPSNGFLPYGGYAGYGGRPGGPTGHSHVGSGVAPGSRTAVGGGPPGSSPSTTTQGSTNSSCVLYLGAIPYNWDVEVIKSVVCGSGPVVDVRCMMDNASKNKGFCFVEYSSAEAASKALSVLSRIKIEGRKKLRIELSKEGLRNPVPGQKPELHLSRNFLPSNVIIPREMLLQAPDTDLNAGISSMGSGLPGSKSTSASSAEIASIMASSKQVKQMVGQMIANGMDMNQIASVVRQLASGGGPGAGEPPQIPAAPVDGSVAPDESRGPRGPRQSHQDQLATLSMASRYLPVPQQAAAAPGQLGNPGNPDPQAIYAKDKVSQTLAAIPPNVLIELLAKLKLVLSGPTPNYQQAAAILHDNPKLAAAAAQSLLLMGIIDLNVINETLAGRSVGNVGNANVGNANVGNSNVGNANVANVGTVGNVANANVANANVGNTNNSNVANAINANANPNPPYSQLTAHPDWLSLPQHTVNKLMAISDQEANLIVQVLKLSPQQIANLPDNERNMANQIRSQYL